MCPSPSHHVQYIHRGATQDAIYIDWQEQLRAVASVVREAVMFLSGARPDCLYNNSLLIYQLPSPPRQQNPLHAASRAGQAPTLPI